jgi:hypothetical protein
LGFGDFDWSWRFARLYRRRCPLWVGLPDTTESGANPQMADDEIRASDETLPRFGRLSGNVDEAMLHKELFARREASGAAKCLGWKRKPPVVSWRRFVIDGVERPLKCCGDAFLEHLRLYPQDHICCRGPIRGVRTQARHAFGDREVAV